MFDDGFSEADAFKLVAGMGNSAVSNDPVPQNGVWAGVDGPSLLAAASSLQLVVENAHFLVRLKRLAAVAARLPSRPDAPVLSSSRMRKLLADPFVAGPHVQREEDPFEGMYVTEIPYFGGPRLVVQGIEGSANVAVNLIQAVMGAPNGTFPSPFVVRMKALTTFLLGLSDRVCRRAGLARGDVTINAGPAVKVPSAKRIADLSGIVQFGTDELWAGMPAHLREYLSATLVQSEADLPLLRKGEVVDDGLILRPLLTSVDRITLASPGDLVTCLRHIFISESYEWECTEQLADALSTLAINQTTRLLRPISGERTQLNEEWRGFSRSTVTFDQDKTLDVICLADDLANYDRSSIFQTWEAKRISERIHAIFESGNSVPEKTLRLVTYQGVGRDIAFGIPHSPNPAPTLFLPLQDLETILQTPGTNEMTLWHFAVATQRFAETTNVLVFSAVDEFAYYRDHDDSFYADDGPKPNMIYIESGYGQGLRIENCRRIDRHHVCDPSSGYFVEAYALHGRQSSPIYLALGASGASLVVEMNNLQVWVRIRPGEGAGNGSFAFELGQAVAFWMWQILNVGPELVERTGLAEGTIEVEVSSHADVQEPRENPAHGSQWVASDAQDPKILKLVFGNPPRANESDPPNYLDLLVVNALESALEEWRHGALAPLIAKDALERIAPSGIKQLIHMYGEDSEMAQRPGNLPEARRLESSIAAQVLDELGDYLQIDQDLQPGPVAPDQRTDFLNKTVTKWLIDRFSDSIQALSPHGLLEKLVALDEALTSETAREPAQLRARLACFGVTDDEVVKLQKYQSKAVGSSLASRFLIEYVTAWPPNGQDPLTNETYDRLLIFSNEIINKGMLSDAINHGISDARISILGSGRVGISRDDDRYHQALVHFGESRARDSLQSAISSLDEEAPEDRVYTLEEADSLAQIEFGFTFTNLAEACGQIIALADDGVFTDVLVLDEESIRRVLSDNLAWEDEKVDGVLNAISLEKRATTPTEFWKAGVSVFPWRFNRQRSYLRRPLLRREGGGQVQVVAGRRRLWQTAAYWLEQFRTGRLQGHSKEMKAALNKIRNAKGKAFESAVATRMNEVGLSRVRTGLRRVGAHDFRNIEGRDLGDIDAMGVDEPNRRIYVVEAKDFEVARTPAELANEIDNLLLSEKAAIRRLSLRADWIRRHVAPTLMELGMTSVSGSWEVCPLVVVDERLLSARLSNSEIPILGIAELGDHLQKARPKVKRRRRR